MAAYQYREIPHVYEMEKPRRMPFINFIVIIEKLIIKYIR